MPNKSLNRSGGSIFRIMRDSGEAARWRTPRLTQPLGAYFELCGAHNSKVEA